MVIRESKKIPKPMAEQRRVARAEALRKAQEAAAKAAEKAAKSGAKTAK